MIRYPSTRTDIETAVYDIDARWLQKAQQRTDALRQAGSYSEASAIWSVVKPVFIDLQRNKCLFCERKFASPEYGRIEYDLEHFRPKSTVALWPDAARHPHLDYGFQTGVAGAGYHWLAYDLGNYAAACKICNSIFKIDFFPVEGIRGQADATIGELTAEEPLLCYPIGDGDDDPEDLITFVITTARPKHDHGRSARRGQVMIDFFGLNAREDLHRERARMIALLGTALVAITEGRANANDHAVLRLAADPRMPHANCLRSFRRFWDDDQETARKAYDLCRVYGLEEPGAPPPAL